MAVKVGNQIRDCQIIADLTREERHVLRVSKTENEFPRVADTIIQLDFYATLQVNWLIPSR